MFLPVFQPISLLSIECAKVLVAQINPLMPFTYGDSVVHMSRFDAIVRVNDPLAETKETVPTAEELSDRAPYSRTYK